MTKFEGIAILVTIVFVFSAFFGITYLTTQDKYNLRDNAYHACMKR